MQTVDELAYERGIADRIAGRPLRLETPSRLPRGLERAYLARYQDGYARADAAAQRPLRHRSRATTGANELQGFGDVAPVSLPAQPPPPTSAPVFMKVATRPDLFLRYTASPKIVPSMPITSTLPAGASTDVPPAATIPKQAVMDGTPLITSKPAASSFIGMVLRDNWGLALAGLIAVGGGAVFVLTRKHEGEPKKPSEAAMK